MKIKGCLCHLRSKNLELLIYGVLLKIAKSELWNINFKTVLDLHLIGKQWLGSLVFGICQHSGSIFQGWKHEYLSKGRVRNSNHDDVIFILTLNSHFKIYQADQTEGFVYSVVWNFGGPILYVLLHFICMAKVNLKKVMHFVEHKFWRKQMTKTQSHRSWPIWPHDVSIICVECRSEKAHNYVLEVKYYLLWQCRGPNKENCKSLSLCHRHI